MGYQSDHLNAVTQTLGRLGESQAQAKLQQGQAWAQALGQIGQNIAAIPQQMAQAKAQKQEAELRQQQIDAAKKAADDQKSMDDAFAALDQMTQPGAKLDTATLLSAVPGHLRPALQTHLSAYEKSQAEIEKTKAETDKARLEATKIQNEQMALAQQHSEDALGKLALGVQHVIAGGGDPTQTFVVGLAKAVNDGIVPKDQAQSLIKQLRPDQIKPMIDGLVEKSKAAMDLKTQQATQSHLEAETKSLGAPKPGAFEQKNVLLDGKPAIVTFDPHTNKTMFAGQEVSQDRIKPIPPQTGVTIQQGQDDAKSIAQAIIRGEQPPDVAGLYRMAGPVRAALADAGYDLTKANLDWQATKKHLQTLNGAQQTRIQQAIGTATSSLDVIDDLASKWKGGGFPLLNKANLALAKNGAYGKDAASIATQLEGQITDVVSELGQVYMGGNSPTDHALGLAEKNLRADWDEKVLKDMTNLARTNLQIRQNSILHSGPVGLSSAPSSSAPADWVFDPKLGKLVKKGGG